MRTSNIVVAAALGSTLLFACSQPCPPVQESFKHAVLSVPPETDANIAVVEGYLKACITADAEGMRAALAPEYKEYLQVTPEDSSDVEKTVADWIAIDSTRTDQKLTMDAVEGIRYASGKWEGDWVHYWGTYSATHKATGKTFKVPFFFDSQLNAGKLLRSYTYYDLLSVYNQLGIAPQRSAKAK